MDGMRLKASPFYAEMMRGDTSSQRRKNSLLIFKQTLRSGTMKTVILEVRSPKESMSGFVNAWKTGRAEKSARIAFSSTELLWQVLTAKRWELLKVLCGIGPVSIREAARRVGRASGSGLAI